MTKEEKERVLYFLDRFLDIAEKCYPKYFSSDFIMEANDYYKELEEGGKKHD